MSFCAPCATEHAINLPFASRLASCTATVAQAVLECGGVAAVVAATSSSVDDPKLYASAIAVLRTLSGHAGSAFVCVCLSVLVRRLSLSTGWCVA